MKRQCGRILPLAEAGPFSETPENEERERKRRKEGAGRGRGKVRYGKRRNEKEREGWKREGEAAGEASSGSEGEQPNSASKP